MTEPVFTGVGVALMTLFDDARQIDHDAALTATPTPSGPSPPRTSRRSRTSRAG